MSQLQFDADTAKRIEALYQIRDAGRRRELVREALGAVSGERILDAGCGPGFYCLELSQIVGLSGSVLGVDSSPAMLQLARIRCAGRDNVGLLEGEATALPVESATFDGAVCVQVLEYVSDVDAALAELHRALRPGGRVVVWDMDWATVSIHSQDTALTTRVLRAWDEHLADPSLPRTLRARLRSAGFENVRVEAHTFAASGRDPETFGAALVPLIATFVAGRQGIAAVEAEAWAAEQRELMERDESYFASTQFCFTATKPPNEAGIHRVDTSPTRGRHRRQPKRLRAGEDRKSSNGLEPSTPALSFCVRALLAIPTTSLINWASTT